MTRASAPGYDRFKTVVAVILAIILLLMLLRGCSTNPVPPAPSENLVVPSATNLPPTLVPPTQTASAANPTVTASPTSIPPTLAVTATPTSEAATTTATPASAATETPTATPEQATSTSAPNTACNTVAPSRLSVGQKARVLQRLNVRNNASIKAAIVKVNSTNSQVEIIGGPTCEPVGTHAYLWWQIRLADGTEGWSAELPLNSKSYFLEPIQ